MTAAEAEKIKAALLIESSHLRRTGESTHCLTCDCFFLKALDAVIEMDARMKRASDYIRESTVGSEAVNVGMILGGPK